MLMQIDPEGAPRSVPRTIKKKPDPVNHPDYEEEEDIKYCQRSKLYTFSESMLNKGTGKKTWNERGIGEIKILKHKESGRLRVLMRQEKTKKIYRWPSKQPRTRYCNV